MLDIFKPIKAKFDELGLSFRDKYEDMNENLVSFFLQDDKGTYLTDPEKQFKKWLEDTYQFRQVKHYAGPDYDSWDQGDEVEGFTVIELIGKYYRLIYEVTSYGGVYCKNFWDWKEVQKVDRAVTFYE